VLRKTCCAPPCMGVLAVAFAGRTDWTPRALPVRAGHTGQPPLRRLRGAGRRPRRCSTTPPATLQREDTLMGGAFLVLRPTAHMDGESPYPGSDYSANNKKGPYWLGHGYAVIPLKPEASTWPAASGAPPASAFPGRTRTRSRADTSRSERHPDARGRRPLSAKLADWFAIGAGPELRFSDVKLSRNVEPGHQLRREASRDERVEIVVARRECPNTAVTCSRIGRPRGRRSERSRSHG